mgnify:CR=1 FL=1
MELFKGLQRGLLGKGFLAAVAGQKIDRFADGHGGAKIEAYALEIAGRTRHLLKPVGDIRLGAQVELHVRVNGEAIEAFFTDPAPFAIRLRKSLIDSKA